MLLLGVRALWEESLGLLPHKARSIILTFPGKGSGWSTISGVNAELGLKAEKTVDAEEWRDLGELRGWDREHYANSTEAGDS